MRLADIMDAVQIAQCFIKLAESEDEYFALTHLMLQKLLYYAQGWHLAMAGTPLFDEQPVAWKKGPVVRSVWERYKALRDTPIDPTSEPVPCVSTQTWSFVKSVWEAYKKYSAPGLVEKTHLEPAWIEAWGRTNPSEPFPNEPLNADTMRAFFRNEAALFAAKMGWAGFQLDDFAPDGRARQRGKSLDDLAAELGLLNAPA